MDGSISPTSTNLSKVVDLAALCTLLLIGQPLPGWMTGTTITGTMLLSHFGTCLWFSQIMSLSPFIVYILSNFFVSMKTGYYCGLGSLGFHSLCPN